MIPVRPVKMFEPVNTVELVIVLEPVTILKPVIIWAPRKQCSHAVILVLSFCSILGTGKESRGEIEAG